MAGPNRKKYIVICGILAVLACIVVGVALVVVFSVGRDRTIEANHVTLKEGDLPAQRLHLLNEGDTLTYVLPNGRRLSWRAEGDLGLGIQTTACGLQAHSSQPDFEELQDYVVCTSTRVKIYRFSIDRYRVERAEDRKATHCLPVIIRVSDLANYTEMSDETARALFAERVPAATGPASRVSIHTVHSELRRKFVFPVRLVIIDDGIRFQVSGYVFKAKEEDGQSEVTSLMNHVVERYEGVDRIDKFAIDVLKDNETAFRYTARKNEQGRWELHAE